jgi:signal peptidase II
MEPSGHSNWKNPWALARFGLTAAAGLSADLLLKHWADVHLTVPDAAGRLPVVQVLPGWLNLEWTGNHGAAMGFFQGDRWLFLIVSAAAVLFLLGLFSSSRRQQRGYQIILGMLLAGVLGNLYDRLFLGYVRDMIHIFPGRRWPPEIARFLPGFWSTPEWFPWIFNIADSLLCVGVALMWIYTLVYGGARHEPRTAAAADAGGEEKDRAADGAGQDT